MNEFLFIPLILGTQLGFIFWGGSEDYKFRNYLYLILGSLCFSVIIIFALNGNN